MDENLAMSILNTILAEKKLLPFKVPTRMLSLALIDSLSHLKRFDNHPD
jgi:hypothetical protein